MPDDTQFLLGKLDGKMDNVLKGLEEMKGRHASLETRVGILEQWRWMILGGASVVGTAASFVLNKLLS